MRRGGGHHDDASWALAFTSSSVHQPFSGRLYYNRFSLSLSLSLVVNENGSISGAKRLNLTLFRSDCPLLMAHRDEHHLRSKLGVRRKRSKDDKSPQEGERLSASRIPLPTLPQIHHDGTTTCFDGKHDLSTSARTGERHFGCSRTRTPGGLPSVTPYGLRLLDFEHACHLQARSNRASFVPAPSETPTMTPHSATLGDSPKHLSIGWICGGSSQHE